MDREKRAAVAIQSWFRTCKQKCKYVEIRSQLRMRAEKRVRAAVVVQRAFRKWMCEKKLREEEVERRENAATALQVSLCNV